MTTCLSRNVCPRTGSILTLSVVLIVVLLAMVAFAVDIGHVCVVRAELQRTADAAAMAGVWELVPPNPIPDDPAAECVQARAAAIEYAAANLVSKSSAQVSGTDVEVGYIADPYQPGSALASSPADLYNAVRVTVRKTAQLNGEVPFFFARVLGYDSMASQASATAVFMGNGVRGFRPPRSGRNIPIIPYAIDQELWDSVVKGGTEDTLAYDPETNTISAGSDGVPEFCLYPQPTGLEEHFGTVNIGHDQNSTTGLKQQILNGVTPEEFAYHGDSLEFSESLALMLDADPGISGGVEPAFTSIIGQTRIAPVFAELKGRGNNGAYTIVKWVGVRIVQVSFGGKPSESKWVMVQPAPVTTEGVIESGDPATSENVYSNVWLTK